MQSSIAKGHSPLSRSNESKMSGAFKPTAMDIDNQGELSDRLRQEMTDESLVTDSYGAVNETMLGGGFGTADAAIPGGKLIILPPQRLNISGQPKIFSIIQIITIYYFLILLGCLNDENLVKVTAKVVYSYTNEESSYSFKEHISFDQSFQHERKTIEVGLKLGGVFKLISAAFGLNFKKTIDTVAASADYSHTKHGVLQAFKPDIYQIHREITTTVTINGKAATLTEEIFVDAIPNNDPRMASLEKREAHMEEEAINYIKRNFGVSSNEIDTSGDGASIETVFCVLGTKMIHFIFI